MHYSWRYSIPRDLSIASISANSSSMGGAGCLAPSRPCTAGSAPAVVEVAGFDFFAETRRARIPPTTQSTRQKPRSASPNQMEGEKMIFDAHAPTATTPSQSSRRMPLKYNSIGANASPIP